MICDHYELTKYIAFLIKFPLSTNYYFTKEQRFLTIHFFRGKTLGTIIASNS